DARRGGTQPEQADERASPRAQVSHARLIRSKGRSSIHHRRSHRVREGVGATPAMFGVPKVTKALRRCHSIHTFPSPAPTKSSSSTSTRDGGEPVLPRRHRGQASGFRRHDHDPLSPPARAASSRPSPLSRTYSSPFSTPTSAPSSKPSSTPSTPR
ncbi:hypothetical protein MUK42_27200, partial [Musa troglodytarum]